MYIVLAAAVKPHLKHVVSGLPVIPHLYVWVGSALLLLPVASAFVVSYGLESKRAATLISNATCILTMLIALMIFYSQLVHMGALITSNNYWINAAVASHGPLKFTTLSLDLGIVIDHISSPVLVLIPIVLAGTLLSDTLTTRAQRFDLLDFGLLLISYFALIGAVYSNGFLQLFVFIIIFLSIIIIEYGRINGRQDVQPGSQRLWVWLSGISVLAVLLIFVYSRFAHFSFATLNKQYVSTAGVGDKSLVTTACLVLTVLAWLAGAFPFRIRYGSLFAGNDWVYMYGFVTAPFALSIVILSRVTPLLTIQHVTAPITMWTGIGLFLASAIYAAFCDNIYERILSIQGGIFGLSLMCVGLNDLALGLFIGLCLLLASSVFSLSVPLISSAYRSSSLSEISGTRVGLPKTSLVFAAGLLGVGFFPPLPLFVGGANLLATLIYQHTYLPMILVSLGIVISSAVTFQTLRHAVFGQPRRRRAFDPERIRDARGFYVIVEYAATVAFIAAGAWMPFGLQSWWQQYTGLHEVSKGSVVYAFSIMIPLIIGGLISFSPINKLTHLSFRSLGIVIQRLANTAGNVVYLLDSISSKVSAIYMPVDWLAAWQNIGEQKRTLIGGMIGIIVVGILVAFVFR